jgi:Leucine-rich repeat (LRR) protein
MSRSGIDIQNWLWLALAFAVGLGTSTHAEVRFPDSALEAVVREAIEKPTGAIQQSDLEGLTKITVYQSEVRDLTGVEHCTNLTFLNCQSNKIEQIECLAKMPQLERAWLTHNNISDISALRDLPNLAHVSLGGNPIEDISPLNGKKSLRRLSLYSVKVSETETLATLTELEQLYISRASLTSLEFVRGMTKLRSLIAGDNQIESIEPLRGLDQLMEIKLENNRISDLSPISGLAEVWWLDLSRNRISSVEKIPGFVKTARVQLYENQISDIRPLVEACGYAGERLIELGMNQLTSDAFCRDIPELEIRGNTVVFERGSPTPKSVFFPDWDTLCSAASGTDGELVLAAVNRGADDDELLDLFGIGEVASATVSDIKVAVSSADNSSPIENAETPVVKKSAAMTQDEEHITANLDFKLSTTGMKLKNHLVEIVLLGLVAVLVLVWKMPRRA